MKADIYNGAHVLTAESDLIGAEAAALRAAAARFDAATDSSPTGWVVDLDRCRYMTSEGLEALLTLLRQCESQGRPLKLAGVGANCKEILHVTRLDRRFECCDNVASALKTLN
jgi:anti-anti-sigma factor